MIENIGATAFVQSTVFGEPLGPTQYGQSVGFLYFHDSMPQLAEAQQAAQYSTTHELKPIGHSILYLLDYHSKQE